MNLRDIAARYGTPTYVYDLAAVRRAVTDLRRALPRPSALYYSVKANPHPHVVAQLARLGCRAEVSSTGEIDVAIRSGFPPSEIMLTGPGKTQDTIRHALDRDVVRFSVESPTELARLGELTAASGARVDCLLRINADEPVPGMALTMTGTASQFGVDAGWVDSEPGLFRGGGSVRVRGLHLYMGTNLDDEDTLMSQFEVAVRLAAGLGHRLGVPVEVDLGGGFGAPFARTGERPRFAGLATRLTELLDRRLPGWRHRRPLVAFESGRYLVADSGVLLSRVVDVKPSKDQVFVVLDTGVHHLGGMSGLRRIPRISPTVLAADGPRRNGADGAGGTAIGGAGRPVRLGGATVVGPLCTPLDTFGRGVELPSLHPGDLVAVPNVGAYGLTASLIAFLGHRTPTEVVVDGDELHSASRLELVRSALSDDTARTNGPAGSTLVQARSPS